MLSSKQKKYLKSEAHSLKPVLLIGKDGLSNNSFIALNQALKAHELVKVSLLQNSPISAEEAQLDILSRCHCEFVFKIGRTLIFYKPSKEKIYKLP